MYSYFNTMRYLLYTQYLLFLQTIHDKIIDLLIWVFSMSAVTIYLLPSFGIEHTYGAFFIVSMAASAGIFEQFSSTIWLVGDFTGDRITSYYTTLPMPSWMVLLNYMIFYAFNTMALAILVLPFSKLLFWHHLDLSHLNVLHYLVILMATCIFYASFTIWLAGLVPNLEKIGNVWMRFIFPLWTFGAFQYSYGVLYDRYPLLARVSLINPFTYIMEGTRAAVLGQEGSLSFWPCVGMTILLSVLFMLHAMYKIKKRLDFV